MKYLSLLLISLFFACTTPTPPNTSIDRYAHIQDKKARTIVQSAIDFAGGIEQWESVKHLRYSKQFDLLLESGDIQKSYNQLHDYTYQPTKINIFSIENGDSIRTIFEDAKYQRSKNDRLLDTSQKSLAKSVNSSTYVLGMPFKLLDAGARISYEGEADFKEKKATVLLVNYDAEKHKNHSSSETWKFYFDQKTAEWLGYWVQSSDHFNTVENISFEQAGDLLWIKERKSYRADSLGNRLYLRADYSYGNYEVGI